MKYLITILSIIACLSTAQAQNKTTAIPYEFVLFDTIDKYCTENSSEFSAWARAYLEKVKAGKGTIYPQSGQIYSPSSRNQERANKMAFYTAIRIANGDDLHSISEEFIVFKTGKAPAPKKKASSSVKGRG